TRVMLLEIGAYQDRSTPHVVLGPIARHLPDTLARVRQRLDQAPADEAGRACDQHPLAGSQHAHQLDRIGAHGAISRNIAIWRTSSPSRGWKICSVKLNLPSGSCAWVTESVPGVSHAGRKKRR